MKDHNCQQCEKAFCRAYQLKRHVAEVHEGLKNYECGTCGKCFSQSSSLKTHIFMIHEKGNSSQIVRNPKKPKPRNADRIGEKKFKCELCNSCFWTKEKFNFHIDKFHNPDFKHKCKCGRSYISAEKLESHAKNQHGGAEDGIKHICDHCGKVLSRADKLRFHLLKFHKINTYPRKLQQNALKKSDQEKIHKCKDCGYCTARLSDLKRHCVTMHGAAPKKLNKCKFCDETFILPGLLKAHILHAHEAESAASNIPGKFLYPQGISHLSSYFEIVPDAKHFFFEIFSLCCQTKFKIDYHLILGKSLF